MGPTFPNTPPIPIPMDHDHGPRLALQTEERRLILALSSVRTQLNALIPISTLPTEILTEVFASCAQWLYEHHGRKHPHRLAWTQVCRMWRDVALSTPKLWSYIDVCDAKLANECLLRSAEAPVHIASTPGLWHFSPMPLTPDYEFQASDLLSALSAHAHRIQSISILLFPEDLAQLFRFCGPALPSLTALSVKVPPISSNFILEIPSCLPCLRRLKLGSVSVPWDTCVDLTHLSLSGLVAGEAPTLPQLLSIFKASPYLEEIHLEHVTPGPTLPTNTNLPSSAENHDRDDTHRTDTQATRIPLPSLRTLHITSNPPKLQIHSILAHLVLPPTAHTVLECLSLDSPDASLTHTRTPGLGSGSELGSGHWTGFFLTSLGALYPDVLYVDRVDIEEQGVRAFCNSSNLPSSSPSSIGVGIQVSQDSHSSSDAKDASTSPSSLISIQSHHRLTIASTSTLIHTILPIFLDHHGMCDEDLGLELGSNSRPVVHVSEAVPHSQALREVLHSHFGPNIA